MKIICVTTGKGGCAKSSHTVELAAALKVYGKRVLVIDVDQSCSLTNSVGCNLPKEDRDRMGICTIYDLLTEQAPSLESAILEIDAFDIIPSDIRLTEATSTFSKPDDEYLLLDLCEMLKDNYDYIFIDHGPQKDIMQKMAIIAANYFIGTTMVDAESRRALIGSVADIVALQNSRNKLVRGEVIALVTAARKNSSLGDMADEKLKEIAEEYGSTHKIKPRVYSIPDAIEIAKAKSYQTANVLIKKSTKASRAYFEIADYILELEEI